ncbi:MAG: outer membrane lipoprotein-sorting protein [Bacteroidales bacterium]|nr:outer membrane lipoprotein-sorting protein [Bacteroidales bacterium]
MKTICKIILALAVMTVVTNAGVFSQTAREITEKASDAIDMESIEMSTTLKIMDNKGRERIRKLVTATQEFNGSIKTIVRFTAPADVKGTAMLIYDYADKADDMWIYLPALRKTRRIVSSEKGKSFMGSEFTNADMSKPNISDFEYRLLSTEMLDGRECWKIETICRNEDIEDEYGYSRKISWIEKNTYLVQKIEFYDFNGELHKQQLFKNYKKQPNGKYFAYYMEKENVQNGRESVMIIDGLQSSSSMPETAFTPSMLAR